MPPDNDGSDEDGRPIAHARPSDYELILLKPLARQFPTIDAALAEIARLSAILTLPMGTVHVISDVHGEDKKLRHIINNASGTLRPVVEQLFRHRMTAGEFQELLTLIFYPAEVTGRLAAVLDDREQVRDFALRMLRPLFELVRALAARYSLRRVQRVLPPEYASLYAELLQEPTAERGEGFLAAIVDRLLGRDRVLHLVHITCRLIRNLAVYELIIAGDCWDRGPRGDRVVDYLRCQPNVSFVWGNHDVAWLGACLGHEPLICHVLRISLRYRRIAQLDEGYSIPMTPLEHLAETTYADDPCRDFQPQTNGLRPNDLVARMHKAAAIMQFKLEGGLLARHPEWEMDDRRLLHRVDFERGTVSCGSATYPLRDRLFPTIDPADPYRLTPAETDCLARLRHSFLASQKLWTHMQYLVRHGAMYLRRNEHLIFHGCVPCDERGEFLPMPVNGRWYRGRPLYDELQRVISRAVEKRQAADLDVLWYLWSGPRSPLFGKDRITTFERCFIADHAAHHETKNPYFALLHEAWFCEKVLAEFGVDPATGLIVNGHVPVRIEEGESPLKRSGRAITIDGAFSEAYGDHGYTLVEEADRTVLALHHHFESIEAAIGQGVDIIPSVTVIRKHARSRRLADTDRGAACRHEIEMLERLVELYRTNDLAQTDASQPRRD
jgi:fructose-1,6-bisphosphatase-3